MEPSRISGVSILTLAVAVLAISSSAVLVRWAAAPAVVLAFWRTLGGALILAPAAARERIVLTRSQRLGIAVAGIALGTHFGTWLASLELTSVAASVSLVATAPIMIAAYLAVTGRSPGPVTWTAIALAVFGTLIILGGDALADPGTDPFGAEPDSEGPTGATSGRALLGDGLALIGAATMAIYLVVGDRLREGMSTVAYASRTYGVAAVTTGVVAVLAGDRLTGFDRTTWLAIGAMIIGPQLAGHTAFNYLLKQFGSVTVSLALLLEPAGAALLVWLFFSDVPPTAAIVGGTVVVSGIGLHILGTAAEREQSAGSGAGDLQH